MIATINDALGLLCPTNATAASVPIVNARPDTAMAPAASSVKPRIIGSGPPPAQPACYAAHADAAIAY